MMIQDAQSAQDLFVALQAQRDQAMNGLAYAQVEIMALKREVARMKEEYEADNSRLESE